MPHVSRITQILLAATLAGPAFSAPKPLVTINEAQFRDKVYACWLGKNIGGTLGMPTEGAREMHNLTFFTPVPQTPAANDDLDLQLLWLKVMQERGTSLTARDLGEYWLRYVPVNWNEYGVGKANMRAGFLPPLSGQIRNKQWRDSNGAWIRSEIWACVAPGQPALAARYAWEDACVDHGGAEGTYAELFTASLESAAFVESDRDRLIAIGLSYIPKDCAVAKSIRAALDAKAHGLDLIQARQAVIEASKSTGWFMAPQNVAFVILGWLYGEGDFGKSICAAVNCGDDTDCTGATLGSIWGILHGTRAIPDAWRKPVGEGIQNVAISGFKPPADLRTLTDATVAMAHRVLRERGGRVAIVQDASTDLTRVKSLRLIDTRAAKELWSRSPYQLIYNIKDLRVVVDLLDETEVVPGASRPFVVSIENRSDNKVDASVAWALPDRTAYRTAVTLPARTKQLWRERIRIADNQGAVAHASITVTVDGERTEIPFAFPARIGVRTGDIALASAGAKVTSDSELDREPGCTKRAIDGVIGDPSRFDENRWHSALTPHPHWLTIELPERKSFSRVIAHFADPSGYPVDFDCQVSDNGSEWTTMCEVRDNTDQNAFDRTVSKVNARYFRLLIRKSASGAYPNAAQVSEIELLP